MLKRAFLGGILGILLLGSAPAWALSDADTGVQWNQAPSSQKIQVANILSRVLGGDPAKYVSCLNAFFMDAKNAALQIRTAAEQCKEQK